MSFVYIVASAPWGPVRIEAAASTGDMLRHVTAQPAHVEDCGTLDAGRVAEVARGMLGKADAAGWIASSVQAAVKAVQQARVSTALRDGSTMPIVAAAVQIEPEEPPIQSTAPITEVRSSSDVDVRAIRAGLKMSQPEFAAAFGFSLGTLRGWEQGRFRPDGPALTLLRVIQHRPEAVREALATT